MDKVTIDDVLKFATDAHEGQTRSNGASYISHPISVARRLAEHGFDDFVHQAVALLHDVIEDCEVTEEEITEAFGADVGISVKQLTNDIPPGTKFAEKQKSLLEHAANMDCIAKRVKMADRIDNMIDAEKDWEPWRAKRYASAGVQLARALEPIPAMSESLYDELLRVANRILN